MKSDWLQLLPESARAQAEAELSQLAFLVRKVALLEEMLRQRRLDRYGRKGETLTDAQLLLLQQEPSVSAREVAQEAQLPEPEKKAAAISPKSPRQPHPGREPLPAHLPRQEVVVACEPARQACPVCHQPNGVIGYEVSEELCVKPAEYYVKVTKREKRACRQHPEGGVATAELPLKLLPKSKLADEVIIDTVVRKYQWHQPLYRQALMLEREAGVVLDRRTLDDGVMWVGELLHQLQPPMRQELFAEKYVQGDETPVAVQTPQVKGRTHRGYLFEFSQPRGVVVFDFQMGRGRAGPNAFLKDFVGTLQTDGYTGYDEVAPPNPAVPGLIRRAGCWAHARRYFLKAHEVAPRETEALSIVETIGQLYQVERQAREQGLDAAQRLALRQQRSVALVAALRQQMEKLQAEALPQSALGRACNYALGQWPPLEVFLSDGQIEIDNNWCENAIRPVTLGRKNWLQIGAESAGPKVAAIMSIMETCRRLKVNVRVYLKAVLPQLARWPLPNVATLTPKAWLASQGQQATP